VLGLTQFPYSDYEASKKMLNAFGAEALVMVDNNNVEEVQQMYSAAILFAHFFGVVGFQAEGQTRLCLSEATSRKAQTCSQAQHKEGIYSWTGL
jgi:hypothetical protein